MPNPLSADIRARFKVLFAEGLSGREIGRRLMISAASASWLSQKLRQGPRLTPAPNPRNTGHGRLAPYHGFLIELIHQDPDITLKELQGAFPGNPYDGHTLTEALGQVEIPTEQKPSLAVVDRGYRGHGVETTRVLISGTRKGIRLHWRNCSAAAVPSSPKLAI